MTNKEKMQDDCLQDKIFNMCSGLNSASLIVILCVFVCDSQKEREREHGHNTRKDKKAKMLSNAANIWT